MVWNVLGDGGVVSSNAVVNFFFIYLLSKKVWLQLIIESEVTQLVERPFEVLGGCNSSDVSSNPSCDIKW